MRRQYRLVARSRRQKPPFPSPTFILAMVVLLVVGYGFYQFANYMINETEMFELKNIRVVGNKFLEKEEILSDANLHSGIKLFSVKKDSLISKILNNKYLEGVSVSRSMPSTLIISVQERQPVAFLVDQNIYMVDQTGIMLPKKPMMSEDNLPLITGLSVAKLLQNRKPLLDVLKLMRKVEEVDPGLFRFISEIHLNNKKTPCFYLIRGGAKVEFGEGNPFRKIYFLSEFIKSDGIINQLSHIKTIDLRFSDRIVVNRKS